MAFWDRMIAGIGQSTSLVGVPLAGGTPFPNNDGYGGVRYGSHASVTKAMEASPSQHFVQNVSCIVPWHWWGAAQGHSSSNTCGEMRRACAQVLDARDNTWKWLYKDAIPGYGTAYTNGRGGSVFTPGIVVNGDGSVRVFPSGNETWEVWPLATTGVPYPAQTFWGGVNRDLISNMRALCVAVQARKTLINAGGTDDRSSAKLGLQLGTDPHVAYQSGQRYVVSVDPLVLTDSEGAGYPYKAYDGDYSAWELVTNDWEWYGFVTGVNIPGQVTKKVGPIWGNWTWTPEWFLAPYQIPWSELQYLPATDPDGGLTPAPPPAPPPAPGENVNIVAAVWDTISIANQFVTQAPTVVDIEVGATIAVIKGGTAQTVMVAVLSNGLPAADTSVDSIVSADTDVATASASAATDEDGELLVTVTGVTAGATSITVTIGGYAESFGVSVSAPIPGQVVPPNASAWARALTR